METSAGEHPPSTSFDRFARALLVCSGGGSLLLGLVAFAVEHATGSLALGLGFLFAGGAAGWALVARALQPRLAAADRLLAAIERLADGDLRAPVGSEGLGEFSPAGQVLHRLAERLGRLIASMRTVMERAQALPKRCEESLHAVERCNVGQESAVQEADSLLAEINGSIQAINEDLENLSSSTEEASSSILEMVSSIDEIARNAAALEQSVDSSTSTIHQMSGSIHQVAASADAVQEMAEETAAAMTQMDRAIQEVSEHVREASVLTERLSQGAEDGSHAVASTIDGIETIRLLTLEARDVLARLAQRIAEIGEIVSVIGSINEETNLLSLNAAIIAAQAGEQGKAFAVVANHVKTLAGRTASSTHEIDRLIQAVQEESGNAVRAMGTGIEAVETGVERSRRAGEALEAIRLSAHDASSRVSEIARAAVEQTRNSKHVAEAARRTSDMVQEISRALGEQRRASEQMLHHAQTALETCRQVHRSTKEQRESSRFVTSSIASISDMIHSIKESTEAHARASAAVAETVSRFLDLSQPTGDPMPTAIPLIRELAAEAAGLISELETPLAAEAAPSRTSGPAAGAQASRGDDR